MHTEFTPNQFSQIYPDGIENHWWQLARSRIVARELSRVCPDQPVLDIGCGRGVTLLHLRRLGIACYGVEPARVDPLPGTAAHIFRGMGAEELDKTDRDRFGVVLLLDVIEHLPDPVSFLEGIADRYRNLGHVIVTVPACPELWTNYDEFNGHYRRYTPDMIQDIAGRLSWELVGRTYFFRLLYPPLWLLSRSGRPRSTNISPPGVRMASAHRALARLLLLEHRAPLGNLRGSSIIASFSVGRSGDLAEEDPSPARAGKSA